MGTPSDAWPAEGPSVQISAAEGRCLHMPGIGVPETPRREADGTAVAESVVRTRGGFPCSAGWAALINQTIFAHSHTRGRQREEESWRRTAGGELGPG